MGRTGIQHNIRTLHEAKCRAINEMQCDQRNAHNQRTLLQQYLSWKRRQEDKKSRESWVLNARETRSEAKVPLQGTPREGDELLKSVEAARADALFAMIHSLYRIA